jgi:histone acetyltransferase MYST1
MEVDDPHAGSPPRPFDAGDHVWYTRPSDNNRVRAQIVRFFPPDQAYVHFLDCDRRYDDTVNTDRLKRLDPADAARPRRRQPGTPLPMRNIDRIVCGPHEIDVWYFSPFPTRCPRLTVLHICEFCLLYFERPGQYSQHLQSHGAPELRRPPGREIYRDGSIGVFEVFGAFDKMFCQCLSLIGKLFLEVVELCFAIDDFVFYVCTDYDSDGAHFVGYFSRHLESAQTCNLLSCIMVLPPYQRRGYGRLMISIAYELAKRMDIAGGPERPLSDLGALAFESYWKDTILVALSRYGPRINSIDALVNVTRIAQADVVPALKKMNIAVRYSGAKKQIAEFDMERVAELFDERRDAIQRRRVVNPELLYWFPPQKVQADP